LLNFDINFIALGTSYLCFTFVFFSFQLFFSFWIRILIPNTDSNPRAILVHIQCTSDPAPVLIRSRSNADQLRIQCSSDPDPIKIRSVSRSITVVVKEQNLHVADIIVSEFFKDFICTPGMSENGKNLRSAHPSKLKNCCKFGTP
jgi:hypothetical protein